MTTWTRDAVASSAAEAALEIWRAVEAQHVISTMRLVETPGEQQRLEAILDEAKPPMTKALGRLHFLLAAPFRYRPIAPGSRFRSPEDPGVFYGALEIRTACAEMGWWRWKGFLMDSPALPELPPVTFTIFPVAVADRAVDLRAPPVDRDRATWTHRSDYSGTQAFGRLAREAGLGLIIYQSVRDPEHAANVAVLAPRAFRDFKSTRGQTWTLLVTRARATWVRRESVAFSFDVSLW
ncbi:MAG: RES family NAD+ phosphorylase [Usitatibacter sp.]